ncbi:autotransporter outer membrane beta-barrel domain-containing protein [Morganella morganii]|uniref:autotransporter outer membrane beta-barrel domain-containing protein n=1 Tax=Morganella morganii TaxID=582 RepID=UPI0034D511FD
MPTTRPLFSEKVFNKNILYKCINTALITSLSLTSLSAIAANATVIDNGSSETVPGTQPATWIVPGAIYAGQSGTGSLTIGQGGEVQSGTDKNGTTGSVLGYDKGSQGTITIDGGAWYDGVNTDNTSVSNGTTAVGGGGKGSLNIMNGGKAALVFLNIGQNGTGEGSVIVDGAGSALLATTGASSGITVGTNGNGKLSISNGAKVAGNSGMSIGYQPGSQGEVIVSGAGSELNINDGNISASGGGDGRMTITDGGVVNSVGGGIATAKASGTVIVDGKGSLWNIGDHTLDIGGDENNGNPAGTGTLILSDQGKLTAGKGVFSGAKTGRVVIGALPEDAPAAAGILDTPLLTLDTADNNLIFNHTDNTGNYIFSSKVEGEGNISHLNGTTVFNNSNTYTGATEIKGSTLIAGDSTNSGAVLNGKNAAAVTISDGGILSGTGTVNGMVINNGLVAAYNTLSGQNSAGNSNFTLAEGLTNNNTINLAGSTPGNTLTIGKSYTGNNGKIILNTIMGDDNSRTDKVILQDADAAGNTALVFKRAGGNGARTDKGILVIDAQGTSKTGNDAFSLSPDSDGYRQGAGTIAAGAYDYTLAKGGDNGDAESWYLTSQKVKSLIDPIPPTPAPGEETGVTEEKPKTGGLRPEIGSYISNNRAMNTMFLMTLHDRLGETQYLDALTGEKKVTSMWMRNIGGHTKQKSGNSTIESQANRYVIQIGGDVADWSADGMDRYLIGLMGGYGNQKSNSISGMTGLRSEGSLNGYHAGIYGTWYQNDADKQGLYIDTWAMYNWFNNTADGQGLSSEKYRSKGFTASVEAGYTIKLGEYRTEVNNMTNTVYILPQAQVIWMGVKSDDFTDSTKTQISFLGNNNIQTRAGIRAFINGRSTSEQGENTEIQPFIEANWIHNTESYGVKLDDVRNYANGGEKNIGEIKIGVESKFNNNSAVWINAAQQFGKNGYSDTQGMLGIKYAF